MTCIMLSKKLYPLLKNLMMNNIKILIAAHKECELPKDNIFLPVQVGRKLAPKKFDMQGDDEGANISEKNSSYCELTAIYWAWKNLQNLDYIGLCHYRRYFNFTSCSISNVNICKTREISNIRIPYASLKDLLKKYDIILAKPKIFGSNLKTDYCKFHYSNDYQVLKEVIKIQMPNYYKSFLKVMEQNNKLWYANMFITSWSLFDNYSHWLFPILEEVEKKVNIRNYSDAQKRIYGYMAERLLNVYVLHHKLKVKQLPILFVTNDRKQRKAIYRALRNLAFSLFYYFNRIRLKLV